MMVSIDAISENPINTRRIKASAEADEALRTSIANVGLLQPVLVTPNIFQNDRWTLLAGHRRLAACRELGWVEIEANIATPRSSGVAETAISAAENMVRAGMHPVDQWRAIQSLCSDNGYSIETAAASLGVNVQTARRMEVLGKMAPEVLEELSGRDMPSLMILGRISKAPVEKQSEAMKRARSADGRVNFFNMAEFCRIRRMPMTRAIFDPKLMTWDEDMFAEPDDDARFTTTEIDEFMALQSKALEQMAAASKGRIVIQSGDKLPPGWVRDFSGKIPKRFAKDDPRKVFAVLRTDDFSMGRVDYTMAHYDADRDKPTEARQEEPQARQAPINKKTLERLAIMKAEAVRQRLETFRENGVRDMLRALLMVFTFDNLRSSSGFEGSASNMIARALVQENGDPIFDVSDRELCLLAAWAINATIVFDHPGTYSASGRGAEHLAMSIGAEMPRTDTKEIMRGVSVEKLVEIAQAQGFTVPSDPKKMRKAMTGSMPNYRLVRFGAFGPMPVQEEEVF